MKAETSTLNRVKNFFTRSRQVAPSGIMNPLQWVKDLFGSASASGAKVNTETALSIPAVYSAVRILSDSIGSIQRGIFREAGQNVNQDKNNPLHKLLTKKPNQMQTAFSLFSATTTQLILTGNAYWYPRTKPGEIYPYQIDFVLPGDVDLYVDEDRGVYFYTLYKKKIVRPDELLHFRLLSLDGFTGLNPVNTCKDAIGQAITAAKFEGKYFSGSGLMKGLISTDQPLKREQVEQLEKVWQSKTSFENGNKTPVLPFGLKYVPLNTNPREAMLEELQRFSVEQIARIFRIPLHMLNHLDRMSFNNIEQMSHDFVIHTLRPIVKMMEAEINTALIPESEQENLYFRFNLDSLLRGDTATRAEYYSKAIQNKWMNTNEVRKLENMNPRPGGENFENPSITV